MFIQAMDDIIVKRYNKDKVAQDQIKVRFVYAPKQRVLLDLLDKAQNIQLPVVAVTYGGLTRDSNRVFNKIRGSLYNAGVPNALTPLMQPVPIDITINMSILTRYQQDFDQIISNFVPYFDPYVEISWRIPDVPDYEIRSQVVWNGSINTTYPTDLNATQIAQVQGDTSFTFKGWLFKSTNTLPVGEILTIYTGFTTLTSFQTNQYTTLSALKSLQPSLSAIDPHSTNVIVASGTVVKGISSVHTTIY
jgi:hypothetical protein